MPYYEGSFARPPARPSSSSSSSSSSAAAAAAASTAAAPTASGSYGNRPARPTWPGRGRGGRQRARTAAAPATAGGEGMRASAGDPQEPRAGDSGSRLYAEYHEGGQPWKKFVYVEPPRRVKEVLEEELYFRRDECRVKHPSEVALEGIWSLRRNFPVGAFQPTVQNPSNLLSQPKYYSRHAVVRR